MTGDLVNIFHFTMLPSVNWPFLSESVSQSYLAELLRHCSCCTWVSGCFMQMETGCDCVELSQKKQVVQFRVDSDRNFILDYVLPFFFSCFFKVKKCTFLFFVQLWA